MENMDLNTDTAEEVEIGMGDVDDPEQDGGAVDGIPVSIDQTPGGAPGDASGSSGSGGAFGNTGG